MKMMRQNNILGKIVGGILAIMPVATNANFYIDYQGVDKPTLTLQQRRAAQGTPNGYKLLTDKTYGAIHQIGSGVAASITSFGHDFELKMAMHTLIPTGWIVYIDDQSPINKMVSWSAKNEQWIITLGRLGSDYGFRFIIDWDQQLIQMVKDENYQEPNENDPIIMSNPETGQKIFVYPTKQNINGGVLIVNGKIIKTVIKQ